MTYNWPVRKSQAPAVDLMISQLRPIPFYGKRPKDEIDEFIKSLRELRASKADRQS